MFKYYVINGEGQFDETDRDDVMFLIGKRATLAMEAAATIELHTQRNGVIVGVDVEYEME